MAKIIDFDNSIESKLEKAEGFYNVEDYTTSLTMLFDMLKTDKKNKKAKYLIARIYTEMNQHDSSNETYFSILADGFDETAVKGVITNLLCQGRFSDARYYKDVYNVDFNFSDFMSIETEDGEVLYDPDDENDEARRNLRLIVSKKTKDGENQIKKPDLENLTVGDIAQMGITGEGLFSFGEIMEKLLDFDDEGAELPEVPQKVTGFKQVYPVTQKSCEEIITKAYNIFTSGDAEKSLSELSKITKKNGKYYYIACKNKVMCYLALSRLASMKAAAEEALRGLPEDYTLKCYYYMSLKLLEEDAAADRLYKELSQIKPDDTVEYMVKLDISRLALDHKGVLDCTNRILEDFPFQSQFLIMKGKAEYNIGAKKAARSTFLAVNKVYPDNFEAYTLLCRVNSDDTSLMTYGDIEMSIKRVKLLSEVNLKLDNGITFVEYLKGADAIRNLEFLLLNESDRNIFNLVSGLRYYLQGEVTEMFKRLLLKTNASDYLKMLLIAYLLFGDYPKRLSVAVGRRLVTVELPVMKWENGLPEVFILAADMSIAGFIINQPKPDKNIKSLTERLTRVSAYLRADYADGNLVAEFKEINNAVVLRRALTDITLNNKSKSSSLSVQEEEYFEYMSILDRIEKAYEIY